MSAAVDPRAVQADDLTVQALAAGAAGGDPLTRELAAWRDQAREPIDRERWASWFQHCASLADDLGRAGRPDQPCAAAYGCFVRDETVRRLDDLEPRCPVCQGDEATRIRRPDRGFRTGWMPCPACVLGLPIADQPMRVDTPRAAETA